VSLYSSSSSYEYCAAPGSRCTYNSTTGYTCTVCGGLGQNCCIDSTTYALACQDPLKCASSGGAYACAGTPTATNTSTATSTSTSTSTSTATSVDAG
jgi:hypothetical protein